MSILEKLNETIEAMQSLKGVKNAHDLAEHFKKSLRGKVGDKFLKSNFANSNSGGMVFVKFSNESFKEANNEKLEQAPVNFIISVEGFDADGNTDDVYTVEMIKYKDTTQKVKQLKTKKFSDINAVKDYVESYMESCMEALKEEGGTASGATGSAGSGDQLTIGGGVPDRSEGNIAVFAKRLDKDTPIKRKKKVDTY
jgi:hypothetical protein